MKEKITFKWKLSPTDFLEREIQIHNDDYTIVFEGGKIYALVNPKAYNSNRITWRKLHKIVENRLTAEQVVNHEQFKLSQPSMERIGPDGIVTKAAFPKPAVAYAGGGGGDVIITDSIGKVIHDSKAERIAMKEEFSKLYDKHSSNPLIQKLLQSKSNSVKDPGNELVYLYEIREALSQEFQDWKKACKNLGVSQNDWKRLGFLSSNAPLKQGRHRGSSNNLRNATDSELREARNITQKMIRGYLKHLEVQGGAP